MIKYQNYSHYKLPITIKPLEYGKLIEQIGNKYITHLNTFNVLIINERDNENFIKLFRKGEFIFEFKDSKLSENSFIRIIQDQKYTFKNSRLISTEIISVLDSIYENIIPIKLIQNFTPLIILLIFLLINDSYDSYYQLGLIPFKNIIKLRRVASKYNWKDLIFNINNEIFNKRLFKNKFNKFWNEIKNKFTENNHMFILFKIKYISGQTLSIGKLQRLNNIDKKWYFEFILDFIELKNNFYKENQIESLIFSYGFKKGKIANKQIIVSNVLNQNYHNYQIPISMNPLNFGIIITQFIIENGIGYILHNNLGQIIKIMKYDNYNEIEIFKMGKLLLKFRDELISENKFMRILDNKKFYFKNGEQFLFTEDLKTKFISKTNKVKVLTNNFITIDIETYIQDGLLIPYLICFYDGRNFFSFYLSNYNSVEQMMLECLKSILIRKYDGYNIYAHNLGKFDIIFLLKYLVKIGSIDPIIHNGRIISLSVNYGKNGQYKIEFRDSLLLLLTSLKSLCKSFKIEDRKSIFPHLFINKNNLEYIGKVPLIKYFIN